RRSVCNCAWEACDDIAGVSAYRFAGIIDLDLRAHLFAIFADALRHFALLARVTVDLHEFQKQILNPFLIDHSDSPVIVIRNRELKLHGFGIESRILSNIWPKRKSASFGLLWVFLRLCASRGNFHPEVLRQSRQVARYAKGI